VTKESRIRRSRIAGVPRLKGVRRRGAKGGGTKKAGAIDATAEGNLASETGPAETGMRIGSGSNGESLPMSDERSRLAHWAEVSIRIRDLRESMLGGDVQFADPAWDLMLDLYVATAQGRMIAVGDACVGARVPPTTALRWIDHLEKLDVVRRSIDPDDRRRTLIRLTDTQLSAMDLFFRSMLDLLPQPSTPRSWGGESWYLSSSNPKGR